MRLHIIVLTDSVSPGGVISVIGRGLREGRWRGRKREGKERDGEWGGEEVEEWEREEDGE